MTFVIVTTIDYCINCSPVIFRYFHSDGDDVCDCENNRLVLIVLLLFSGIFTAMEMTFVIVMTIDYCIDCSPVIFRYFHGYGDDVCDRDNIRACVYLQTGT